MRIVEKKPGSPVRRHGKLGARPARRIEKANAARGNDILGSGRSLRQRGTQIDVPAHIRADDPSDEVRQRAGNVVFIYG